MSITNTPGTYPVTVIDAEIGDVSENGTKPALRLTFSDSSGDKITYLYRLYAGAKEWSLRGLDEAFGYRFPAPIESLKGKPCRIKTEMLYNDQTNESYYGVKGVYRDAPKPLAKAAPNLMQQLAADFAALPAAAPSAPRPPRSSAPRQPAPTPPPRNDFADDDSVPF